MGMFENIEFGLPMPILGNGFIYLKHVIELATTDI